MAGPSDTPINAATLSTGTGGDFATASGSTASGTLSGLTGPWYIETQSLNIYYARVPYQRGADTTVSLASATTTNGSIEKTCIAYWYEAVYDTTVSYNAFATSATQQPQEFTIYAASGDVNGVTYGNISASTLGPMGNIITTKPFISRTLYTGASWQPLVSRVSRGSNWNACRTPTVGANNQLLTNTIAEDASPYMYDLKWHKDTGSLPGTARNGVPFNIVAAGDPAKLFEYQDYTIPEAYDTTKEALGQIKALLNAIAWRITNEKHFAWPVTNLEELTGPLAPVQGVKVPKQDEGFVEYDATRHA